MKTHTNKAQLSMFAEPVQRTWMDDVKDWWTLHSWFPEVGIRASCSTTIALSILWKEAVYSSFEICKILKVKKEEYIIVFLEHAKKIVKIGYYEIDPLLYDYKKGNPYYEKDLDDEEL